MSCGCIGNYHEPNVDWLIAEIKKALAQWDKTEADWEEMKKWIQDYFANLDITADVNAKLDEMAKDGTLESIVNEEIFSDLDNRVTQNTTNIAAANTRIDNIDEKLDKGYAIIIGDSYAVGESSGGENTSWATILKNELVAQKQFRDVVILRKNGAGFNVAGNSFLDLLSAYAASPTYPLNEIKMIIVGTAGNDAWHLTGLDMACNQFYNYCKTTFSNALLKVGFIGWTYSTNLWATFKSAFSTISTTFSNLGSMIFGVEQIMHYYPYYASGDSSHPNATGQIIIAAGMMNGIRMGYYTFMLAQSAVQITAPATQRVTGNMLQSVYGNIVYIRTNNLVMYFDTAAELFTDGQSTAKLGDMHLENCAFISQGTSDKITIVTGAKIHSNTGQEYLAVATINIVAAEILISLYSTDFQNKTQVSWIQFEDANIAVNRMDC